MHKLVVRCTVGFSSLMALLNSISAGKHNGDNFGSSWIAFSKNPQRDSVSLLFLFDGRKQILGFQNWFTIDMRDKITHENRSIYILPKRLQSRQHGRAVGENLTDQTSFQRNSQLLFDIACNPVVHNANTQRWSHDFTVDNKLVDNATNGINRNGKSNSNIPWCSIGGEN
jgi:hypothetical protein